MGTRVIYLKESTQATDGDREKVIWDGEMAPLNAVECVLGGEGVDEALAESDEQRKLARKRLVETVVGAAFGPGNIDRLEGYRLLVGRQTGTLVGVFVIDGDFSRAQFEKCLQEAKQAGLSRLRLVVFGKTATYKGRSILFTGFDELGAGG